MRGEQQPIGADGAIETTLHGNGARVCVAPDPGNPLVALSVRLAGGSADDPIGKSGLAHLFEHLLFVGTPKTGRDAYAKTIQDLGAYCNASTLPCWTKFYELCSSDVLPTVLEMEADRFRHTMGFLTESVLEREKAVVRSERVQRVESAAYGDALERLYPLLYDDVALARLPVGLIADIDSITLEDCRQHFENCFTGPRVSIVLSGGIGGVEADCVTELADSFPSFVSEPPVRVVSVPRADRLRVEIDTAFPPKIYLGLMLPPAEDPEYDEARLASYLVGKGHRPWLSERLAKDHGTAASVRIKTMARVGAPSVGIIEAIPARRGDLWRVLDSLYECLTPSALSAITADHVARARAEYTRAWHRDDSTTVGRADGLSLALMRSGDAQRYWRELEPAAPGHEDRVRTALGHWSGGRIRGEVIYL